MSNSVLAYTGSLEYIFHDLKGDFIKKFLVKESTSASLNHSYNFNKSSCIAI